MRRTHEELMQIALSRPGVKRVDEALESEFTLLEKFIKARLEAGKTQNEVAQKMRTSTSTIGCLETGGGKHKHSPTLATLQKYAQAVGCVLQLK